MVQTAAWLAKKNMARWDVVGGVGCFSEKSLSGVEGRPHKMEYGTGSEPVRSLIEENQSTRSMKLPLEKNNGDPDTVLGSWFVFEGINAEQGGGVSIGAAPTRRIGRTGRVTRPNVTVVDQLLVNVSIVHFRHEERPWNAAQIYLKRSLLPRGQEAATATVQLCGDNKRLLPRTNNEARRAQTMHHFSHIRH